MNVEYRKYREKKFFGLYLIYFESACDIKSDIYLVYFQISVVNNVTFSFLLYFSMVCLKYYTYSKVMTSSVCKSFRNFISHFDLSPLLLEY